MNTNDLKKGTSIVLRNGWKATIMDNKKGDIRLADVEGHYREIGSVYSHDIEKVKYLCPTNGWMWTFVTHTPKQLALREMVDAL